MDGDRRSPKKATFQAPFGLWPTRLIAAAAAAYATLLVIATHTPRPERVLGSGLAASDKLLHVVAYGGLGLLAALLVRARGRLVPRLTPLLAAGLAVWAAIDEATQPLFGRHGDPLDWIADIVGIAAGIAAVVVAVALADAHRAAAGTPARDPGFPGGQ